MWLDCLLFYANLNYQQLNEQNKSANQYFKIVKFFFLQLLSMLLIFSFPKTVGDAPGSGPRLGQTAQNQVKLKLVNSKSSF